MPNTEPAIASLIAPPDEATRSPQPQFHLTDDFIAKSYDSKAHIECIGNSLSHQILALSQTLQATGADPSVQILNDALLQAFIS